jgi:hypothetical protein
VIVFLSVPSCLSNSHSSCQATGRSLPRSSRSPHRTNSTGDNRKSHRGKPKQGDSSVAMPPITTATANSRLSRHVGWGITLCGLTDKRRRKGKRSRARLDAAVGVCRGDITSLIWRTRNSPECAANLAPHRFRVRCRTEGTGARGKPLLGYQPALDLEPSC